MVGQKVRFTRWPCEIFGYELPNGTWDIRNSVGKKLGNYVTRQAALNMACTIAKGHAPKFEHRSELTTWERMRREYM